MHRQWLRVAVSLLSVQFAWCGSFTAKHVVLVVEENHGYKSAYESDQMPYLKQLAADHGVAVNYYANVHPSIGNYFMMTTGRVVTTNDNFSGAVPYDNIVRQLMAAKKTWRAYAESLPSVGYIGGDASGGYVKRHVPMAYFTDVRNDHEQRKNLVPFKPQFADDLSKHQLPDFSFVIPNLDNDAHGLLGNGSLSKANDWLKRNIDPLVTDAQFRQDGILIITFDEAEDSDKAEGGGHIVTVIVSPKVVPGTKDETFYKHESLLWTVEEALGLPKLGLGAGMNAMFK
jgi:hypothetical protein